MENSCAHTPPMLLLILSSKPTCTYLITWGEWWGKKERNLLLKTVFSFFLRGKSFPKKCGSSLFLSLFPRATVAVYVWGGEGGKHIMLVKK